MNALLDHNNVISFAFNQLKNVAGDYELVLFGHSLGYEVVQWNLGKIQVSFVTGESQTTNNHISAAFLPQPEL